MSAKTIATDLNSLVRRLSDENANVRGASLLEALETEHPQDILGLADAILARLEDIDPFVRRAALDALGQLSHRHGIDFGREAPARVARLATDSSEHVRKEVAFALAVLPASVAVSTRLSTLLSLLDDASVTVRREAVAALGDLGETAAADSLAARIFDPDDQIRFEAAFALASLGDARALDTLVLALRTAHRRLDACEALFRLRSDAAIPALMQVASKWLVAWPDRLSALATLYSLGRTECAEAILARTKSRNRGERAYALALIGTHQIREGGLALVAIAEKLKDPLRDTAIRALGDLGDAAALPVLEAIVSDRNTSAEERQDALVASDRIRKTMRSSR